MWAWSNFLQSKDGLIDLCCCPNRHPSLEGGDDAGGLVQG